MIVTLLYHDVIECGNEESSGFGGAGAARYKLTVTAFRHHLDAIASVVASPPTLNDTAGWQLTFDDGGASAAFRVSEMLEERGWRGAFFITTDRIGTPGFMSGEEIRGLSARGHLVGTHSCSHPPRMSQCSARELLREWEHSRHTLADVLGEAVSVGSVPGGFYSRRVAIAAANAGLLTLYTSEPTTREAQVGICRVLGRFAVHRETAPDDAAALVSGSGSARLQQWLSWNVKKAAKGLGGVGYLRAREFVLSRMQSRS